MMFNPTAKDPRKSKKAMNALALKFFIIGFFGLPFVWLHSFLYFFKCLRNPEAPLRAKQYIWASLALFLAETGALVIWFVIYSFEWNYWGPFGENISIFYPRG